MEHASAKDLIVQIQEATEIDEMFDAKVKVLGEYIDHHVKEERTEMFPKARAARGLDLVAMREQLRKRKEELMADMTVVARQYLRTLGRTALGAGSLVQGPK
ncbi:hypothetical protein GmRootV213_06430 [Variovorax sp. V213]